MYDEPKSRRPYRVGKKEVERSTNSGLFIPTHKKQHYVWFAAGILVFTFIQGFILGFFTSRD